MISIGTVSAQAIEYARASLSDGLSLSQSAVQSLDQMGAVVLVPDDTSSERALDFKRGGLGRCDLAQVTTLLAKEYPNASLVVELPLWRPEDPSLNDADVRVIACADEVYAVCQLNGSLAIVEKTLRLADPAFMYNAIVLESETDLSAGVCPSDLVNSGAATIKAVLVGAYDGEGFVFARSQPLT